MEEMDWDPVTPPRPQNAPPHPSQSACPALRATHQHHLSSSRFGGHFDPVYSSVTSNWAESHHQQSHVQTFGNPYFHQRPAPGPDPFNQYTGGPGLVSHPHHLPFGYRGISYHQQAPPVPLMPASQNFYPPTAHSQAPPLQSSFGQTAFQPERSLPGLSTRQGGGRPSQAPYLFGAPQEPQSQLRTLDNLDPPAAPTNNPPSTLPPRRHAGLPVSAGPSRTHRATQTGQPNSSTSQTPVASTHPPLSRRTQTRRPRAAATRPQVQTMSSDSEESAPASIYGDDGEGVRAAQLLRGAVSTKMVASAVALRSLQSVPISELSEVEKVCVICYNEFGVETPEGINEAPLRLPKCKHIFGDHCIKKWFEESDSCPYCRDRLASEARVTARRQLVDNFSMSNQLRELLRQDPHAAHRLVANREYGEYVESMLAGQGIPPLAASRSQVPERRSPPTEGEENHRRQRPRHESWVPTSSSQQQQALRPPLPSQSSQSQRPMWAFVETQLDALAGSSASQQMIPSGQARPATPPPQQSSVSNATTMSGTQAQEPDSAGQAPSDASRSSSFPLPIPIPDSRNWPERPHMEFSFGLRPSVFADTDGMVPGTSDPVSPRTRPPY